MKAVPDPGRRRLGDEGEGRAASWLEAQGWRILQRNARADRVEIDMIAERAGVLAFVEVKTRRSRAHGPGELAVDARKRARLVRGAAAWLREHRSRRPRRVRFDVIVCERGAAGWRLRHLPGAFEADEGP